LYSITVDGITPSSTAWWPVFIFLFIIFPTWIFLGRRLYSQGINTIKETTVSK
jgi:hypothetical protein